MCQAMPLMCDNCVEDRIHPWEHHRCRSNPDSCQDGIECPDYLEGCTCGCNNGYDPFGDGIGVNDPNDAEVA
jgi:hypothetical protein